MKLCACSPQHSVLTGAHRAAGLLRRSFLCTLCTKTWVLTYPDKYATEEPDEPPTPL